MFGMTRLTWLLAVSVVCWGPFTLARADGGKPVWEKKTYTNAMGQQMPYRVLPPEGHDPKKAYPLVVFLDGIGSHGTDNKKQLRNASLLVTAMNRKKYPCFVVAPQCP